MKNKIIFLILFLSNLILAQDSLRDNRFCIKLAPLALLDIYNGMSPRIGIEYKLKGNTALYNELGTFISGPNSIQNNKGIILKVELKYYLNKQPISSGNYLSAELFYKHQSFTTWDTILIRPNYRKDFAVSKNVGCFTIKYGLLKVFKYGFVLDGFVGMGIRYKIATNNLSAEENRNIQSSGDYSPNIAVDQSGQFILPNVALGIKIGYRLK